MTVIVFVFLILAALVLFLIAPAKALPEQKKAFYKRNFAHRGLYTQDQSVPENSMEAFRAAVAAGYGIELDVHLLKDGNIAVIHDSLLNRTTGQAGRIEDLTTEDLRIDHPYNTYTNIGLTPGPISNPGLDSLRAALDPDDTNYHFYALNPSTGLHHFSKTLREHENFLASLD